MPEGKDIVIDSKVSLTHYERFCSAGDDSKRTEYLKQHVHSIRRHIKELSDKEYHLLGGLRTIDFVLMFVPVEAAFSSATGAEPELYSEALCCVHMWVKAVSFGLGYLGYLEILDKTRHWKDLATHSESYIGPHSQSH